MKFQQRSAYRFAFLLLTTLSIALVSLRSEDSRAAAQPLSINSEVSDELTQIVQTQSESWNRGDIASFMTPYWNDQRLTFSSGGKTKRGWTETFENYKKNYPDLATMGKLTFSELETQELGPDAMLMIGQWHLDRTEPIGGNFSLVWKRIDGKWLIVHDHSSALRPLSTRLQ